LIDVLDRVLDKGIIIDGWGRVSVIGIDLIGIDAWWWSHRSKRTFSTRNRSGSPAGSDEKLRAQMVH